MTFAELAELARVELDRWGAEHEHDGAARFFDLDWMPDPGFLVGFM
ncbi:MAG: hypothetical protein GY939_21960 [Actinomycetia bacterium]|nr:hypothetical protein [Actinomycetes bacterium]